MNDKETKETGKPAQNSRPEKDSGANGRYQGYDEGQKPPGKQGDFDVDETSIQQRQGEYKQVESDLAEKPGSKD
jgi:hypothetical protein